MSPNQIPEQMTAVILTAYKGAEALRVEHRPVPQPAPHEVLIKVAASPINPSDLSFLQGIYGFQKPTPTIPGFEGSGTVVAVGSKTGLMGRFLMGKRVACVTQDKGDGLWAEYAVTSVNFALPLDKAVNLEQGAMSVVNPLTAVALLDIAKKAGHKTIINTAAASVLGQMMIRLGQSEGIEVIGIVRRQAQVDLLKQQGAAVVLNSSEPDFAQQLHDVCQQHNVRLAFDAIAGSMATQLLDAMPNQSKVTIYGGLSEQPVKVTSTHTIFQNKVVDGFWLTPWVGQKSFLQSLLLWRRAQKLMLTALKTEVRARYTLQEAQQAVTDYEKQMTGGKLLIIPEQQ
jgi:NADPH:quinone reductase-like Zn-dependent oxidoreductase